MPEAAISSHGALFLAHVHPSDRFRVESILEGALRGDSTYVATYRWIRPDTSEVRHLHIRAILEPDGSVFRGMVLDVTSEVAAIQSDPELTTVAGNSLNILGLDGVILDLEFRIRGIFSSHAQIPMTFGLPDARIDRLAVGLSLPDCFLSVSSQEHVHRILDQALNFPEREFSIEWPGVRATIRALAKDGIPTGIGISLLDVTHEQELGRENKALLVRLNQLAASPEHVSEIANISQEIVGYAALVKRQSNTDPMLEGIVDALVLASRALGERTRKLVTLHTTITESATREDIRTESRTSGLVPHGVEGAQFLLASAKGDPHAPLPTLLRDEGVGSIVCSLEEHEIREQLLAHDFIRIAVLDVPNRDFKSAPLIRSLRRLFPALHTICLVPGSASDFSDLQRAGAFLVMPKPVTAAEIGRVLKGLLDISCPV